MSVCVINTKILIPVRRREILIENTETRDQPKNRENAMRQLRSILYDKELQHRMAEQAKVEAGKKKIEWGSRSVATYLMTVA